MVITVLNCVFFDILLNVQTYAWHPLLNSRQKGCKLKLAIYIDDDDDEAREATDADVPKQVVGTADGNRPVLGMCESYSYQ